MKKLDLLRDLWRGDVICKMKDSFQARLCPLNKVWPDIPQREQFRPIAILSAMFKFLELRFLGRLNGYLKYDMDPNQIGFVKGMSTQVNIRLLIEKLKSVKAKDGECTLLIDFKSAYNTVNRQRLYAIMLKKQILPPEEIDFLKILHDNLYFVGKDKRRVFLQNGVHQGSPISPALFNIYIAGGDGPDPRRPRRSEYVVQTVRGRPRDHHQASRHPRPTEIPSPLVSRLLTQNQREEVRNIPQPETTPPRRILYRRLPCNRKLPLSRSSPQ